MADLIRQYTSQDLERLIEKSRVAPRRRAPFPLTPGEFEGPRCLIKPIQPDSYVATHRHGYEEIWMAIQGRVILGLFDESGRPTESINLSRNDVLYHMVPGNVFHFAFAVEPDFVFFNITKGPFDPSVAKEFAPWAPLENAEQDKIRTYFDEVRKKLLSM
jgi:cupin fold WbuC family metalloprotein